ncbi:MAG TPA: hypothetical protein QGH10_21255 [Armatimonadota bacterium]|nr:hypothetical protein [Armatimonadota bacterium]
MIARVGFADDVETFKALYDRLDRTAPLMIRIVNDHRHQLDLSAYHENPLFHYPLDEAPNPPAAVPELGDLDFDGTLVADTICDRPPPEVGSKATCLAWAPLMKRLSESNWDAALPLLEAESKVSGEMWGNDDLVHPLQKIALAYVGEDDIWVMVEFRPELEWIPAQGNGRFGLEDCYRDIYARLNVDLTDALREEIDAYASEKLDDEELEQFFYELASDWYQGYRTETLEPEDSQPWPNTDTEPEILELLDGSSFEHPFAVMKGKPYGEVIYNVFVLPDYEGPAEKRVEQAGTVELAPDVYASEVAEWGGSYEAWTAQLGEFRADVEAKLQARPKELTGLIGEDGFLFFRGDLEYLLAGDLRRQENNPYPVIIDFKNQLKARGIDFLMVFIPTKAEVFPENVSAKAPPGAQPYVSPYVRKLAAELTAAGVECVDLLPEFIAQRDIDGDLLYMPTDTHWTPRGAELAAKIVADRVRQYEWYLPMRADQVKYTTQPAPFTRRGDICDMLMDAEKLKYPPMKLTGTQIVAPDGSLYEDDPDSSIVMLGDSFTGVFHFEDCQHAGVSAHVAKQLGTPLDLISAQGSGPRIRGQFARRGADAINAKKLVIWTCVTRDLYEYWAPWDIIKLP